ncbi:MAG: hypothetical protein GY756_00570 [bacterium]|nr:hypothetical protein [bacterium]
MSGTDKKVLHDMIASCQKNKGSDVSVSERDLLFTELRNLERLEILYSNYNIADDNIDIKEDIVDRKLIVHKLNTSRRYELNVNKETDIETVRVYVQQKYFLIKYVLGDKICRKSFFENEEWTDKSKENYHKNICERMDDFVKSTKLFTYTDDSIGTYMLEHDDEHRLEGVIRQTINKKIYNIPTMCVPYEKRYYSDRHIEDLLEWKDSK